MKVITPEQSSLISAEIYAQACLLDDAADQCRLPWGELVAERLHRLSERRFAVACCVRTGLPDRPRNKIN
jgi:hypothetical protein